MNPKPRTSREGPAHPTRIAVVGAGAVGSSFAFALLLSGLTSEIMLIDANERKAGGEAMEVLLHVERRLARFADLNICNSAAGKEWGAAHGYPVSRMVVIPNGIDSGRFKPDALARAELRLRTAIADKVSLPVHGARARDRIVREFSVERLVRTTAERFDDLLAGSQ